MLSLIRTFRDALPWAALPEAANGKPLLGNRQKDDAQQSDFQLTVSLLVIDTVAPMRGGSQTSYLHTTPGTCLVLWDTAHSAFLQMMTAPEDKAFAPCMSLTGHASGVIFQHHQARQALCMHLALKGSISLRPSGSGKSMLIILYR